MRIKSFILALILGCMSVLATISTAHAEEAFLTYTPSSGSLSFSSSTSNGREAKVKFKWNIAGCSEFNESNDTYEQELVFYNYDGKAYATSMRSYRTNLPTTIAIHVFAIIKMKSTLQSVLSKPIGLFQTRNTM